MAGAYETSEYAGFIRGSAARLVLESPADTGDARDGVVNNLNHIEDSSCQCLININGRTSGKASWDGPASSADFARVALLPPMPVCLRALADGNTSRLVIRLDAQITIAGTATFRFALMPYGRLMTSPPPAASLGFSNVCELSTSSTSVVELGPASVYASARSGSTLWRDVPAYDGAGELGAARALIAQLEVWTFSSSTGIPRISALTAHEWVA